MPPKLKHEHSKTPEKFPKVTDTWVSVDSGWVVVSNAGKTVMWSTGFAGCIGVVMCGSGKWGAMAHLNQKIQTGQRNLQLALSTVADFVRKHTKDKITDVLLFYGDPGSNLGENLKLGLTKDKVKEVMGCQNIIDLRRTSEKAIHGVDFVYDPGPQIVYTAPGSPKTIGEIMGLLERDDWTKQKKDFPYPKDTPNAKVILDGLGHAGWCAVP